MADKELTKESLEQTKVETLAVLADYEKEVLAITEKMKADLESLKTELL